MAKIRSKKAKLTSKEEDILYFVWIWKVVSLSMIHLKFYQQCSSNISYKIIRKLVNLNFLKVHYIPNFGGFVYEITPKGFDTVKRNRLPELKEDGFKSENIEHDFLVSGIHLGDWVLDQPIGAEVFTEQELRRYTEEDYPEWLSKNMSHRPDGYWLASKNGITASIALEVELSKKAQARYKEIARFYAVQNEILSVLWVVRTPQLAKFIQKTIESESIESAGKHNYVLESETKNKYWQAVIFLGKRKGLSIADFIGKNAIKTESKSCHNLYSYPLLDPRVNALILAT